MNKRHLLLGISAIFSGIGSLYSAPGPGDQGTFGNKRVVLFGIDGCRADALKKAVENGTAPNMAGLIADGAVTWNAFAGGIQGTPTEQQTSSGSGWASVLTAVWRDKHGVNGNDFSARNFGTYPHFFKRIKEEHPQAELSSLVSWSPIHDIITEDSGGDTICDCHTYTSGSYDNRDSELITKTIELINSSNPDVVFCYQGAVDIAGHGNQFHPDNVPYMTALATADLRIGQVLNAIRNRPQYDQEDWLYIITTDHGGRGNGHGGQSAEERIIPFVVAGGASPKGLITRQVIGQVAAPATAFRHLGLSIPEAWGWESDAFMIGARLNSSTSSNAVYLSWDLPEAGIEGLTGFRLFRDDQLLATFDATQRHFADTSVQAGTDPVSYRLELTGSGEADLIKSSSRPAITSNTNLPDPVMHLAFDQNLDDTTTNDNDATAVGTPTYAAGISDQAIQLDANFTAMLGDTTNGAPSDLRFGADTDFTISFWIKASAGWTGDPSLISNKNWSSGGNQGWIIAQEQAGDDWQWNFKGADSGRKDFDPSGVSISDGDWHHIVVAHDRDGNADFYHDGQLISSLSIAGNGDVDTSFPIRLGIDGNNNFQVNQPVLMDELKIWRSHLSAEQVTTEYIKGSGETIFASWISDQAELVNDQTGLLGPNDDADGDLASNLYEFAAGTSPFKASDRPFTSISKLSETQSRLIFAQRNGGTGTHGVDLGYQSDGLIYIVETTDTLGGEWDTIVGTAAVQNSSEGQAGTVDAGSHLMAIDIDTDQIRQFWRVRVEFAQSQAN